MWSLQSPHCSPFSALFNFLTPLIREPRSARPAREIFILICSSFSPTINVNGQAYPKEVQLPSSTCQMLFISDTMDSGCGTGDTEVWISIFTRKVYYRAHGGCHLGFVSWHKEKTLDHIMQEQRNPLNRDVGFVLITRSWCFFFLLNPTSWIRSFFKKIVSWQPQDHSSTSPCWWSRPCS